MSRRRSKQQVSAMSRLSSRLGCPPMPAFRRGPPPCRPRWGSDSDSFNPYDEAGGACPEPRAPCRRPRKRRLRTRVVACPCCPPPPAFQRMEVVPGLWFQLEAKGAWHWIGNPLLARSVLAPLSAVPLGPLARPQAPPPLALLHSAVFPAGLFRAMAADANMVLCMVTVPPPDSIGAWYSIDSGGRQEGAKVDVTVSTASSCEPWYTLPPEDAGGGGDVDDKEGCWIWFPVPPHTIVMEEEGDEPLLLGRWMTDTLRSA